MNADIFTDPDGWEYLKGGPVVRDGKFPEECSAASMAVAGNVMYMIRWRCLHRYYVDQNRWDGDKTPMLPNSVGPGCGVVYDGDNALYITRGGDMPDFWRYDIAENSFATLQLTPDVISTGGQLAVQNENLYALRGGGTRDIWRYSIPEDRWFALPPILCGCYLGAGETCTGLVATKEHLITWTDHHSQIYDPETGRSTGFVVTFRPWTSGSMFAYDEEEDVIYMAQGRGSRTLAKILVQERRFHYLYPRTPDGLLVEGNRMLLHKANDRKCLHIYRGYGTHEFWRIPTDKLQVVST